MDYFTEDVDNESMSYEALAEEYLLQHNIGDTMTRVREQ
jgi:hypothetical protein